MKVRDLMTLSLCTVRPNTSVRQAAKLMKQENLGCLPVCNDRNEPLGIITDRDIVLRSVSLENGPGEVKDIMTRNLVYATPSMDSHEASLLMAKNQVRRLPVVENNRIIGMLALADVARKASYIDEAGDALSAISKQNGLQ